MRKIFVYADWADLPQIKKMGVIHANQIRGKEVFSFEYDVDWLKSGFVQTLDPELKLFRGPQYLKDDKVNFGIFLDSSPDRWGRVLMQRRAAIISRQNEGKKISLKESDYLLGVNDETRMGGLRFSVIENGPYLANDPEMQAPPFSSIRSLEEATLQLEASDFFEKKDAAKWLKLLVAPGSSLGGARPKANVRDPNGQLWIAKFPSKNDQYDAGAWEYVVNQIAAMSGIEVANVQARRFLQKQHTFLSKRFDRNKTGRRIHFASAMTLLGYKDGHSHQEGGSYLELIELIERFGATSTIDIRNLWKRIVFSVLISNTDDHLRNHGFLLGPKGWRLSPAYDLNPDPQGRGLSLNINEHDNRLDLDLCLEVAAYFRWKDKEANEFISATRKNVASWPIIAKKLNIPSSEQMLMEPAFSLA